MNSHHVVLARRSLIGLAALIGAGALALPTSAAPAYSETSTKAVNVDNAGWAIRGYDPVAYFTVAKPIAGNPQFTPQHDGATYRFASAANRDAFDKEPAKDASAFGGFCAMGAVFEKKLDGDPNLWPIVGGKLPLNVGKPAQKRWLEDVPGNIGKAQTNWTKIKDKAPKNL